MKLLKRLTLLLLLIPSVLISLTYSLLEDDGSPKQGLVHLSRVLTQIRLLPEMPSRSRDEINSAFQRHLRRKARTELRYLPELSLRLSDEKRLRIAIENLGLEQPSPIIEPVSVDYLLVYGTTFSTAEKRIREASRLINFGLVTTQCVVLLPNDRQLTAKKELGAFFSFLENTELEDKIGFYKQYPSKCIEANMLEDLWNHYSREPCVVIDVPKKTPKLELIDSLLAFKNFLPSKDTVLSLLPCVETPFAHRIIRQTHEFLSHEIPSLEIIPHIFHAGHAKLPILLDEITKLLSVESSCW